jgi:uncharacterized protein (TIGR02265 family)
VRRLGRDSGAEIVSGAYRNLVVEGNPMESLKKHKVVFNMFFDFGEADFEQLSETSGKIRIRRFDPDFEMYYHIFAGWLEECFEMSGAKNARGSFTSRSWAGDPETIIEFTRSM